MFCGNYFLRLGQIGVLAEMLVRKYPVPSVDNVFVFVNYLQYKYIFSSNSLYTVLSLSERGKLYRIVRDDVRV